MGRFRSLRSMLTVALGLAAVAAAFAPVGPAGAASICDSSTVVINQTQQCTWHIQRDTANATAGGFNTEEASVGKGSLRAGPIGSTAIEKFIAENFIATPVADITSIAYDFLIAGTGDAGDAQQFYLNVYANIDDTDNFYDCKFDYVESTGSTAAFTTASVLATDVPTAVTQRGTRITTCPTTLAGMPSGSHVRMFSLNVGDTTAVDAGLVGYLDNVKLVTTAGTTTTDFEEPSTPVIVPAATTVVEGDSGTTVAEVPVALSVPTGDTVTASWATFDYQGTAPADYVAASGTVTFTPNEISTTVPVTINSDLLDEADESVLVVFSAPQNATIGGFLGLGAVTITDDDAPPVIIPRGANTKEGDTGTKVLEVPVTLSAPSGRTVTAEWATLDDQAVAPSDYVADSGTVTFTPGQTLQTVSLTINGDTDTEAKERFFALFTNPTNANMGGIFGLGFATIRNDD